MVILLSIFFFPTFRLDSGAAVISVPHTYRWDLRFSKRTPPWGRGRFVDRARRPVRPTSWRFAFFRPSVVIVLCLINIIIVAVARGALHYTRIITLRETRTNCYCFARAAGRYKMIVIKFPRRVSNPNERVWFKRATLIVNL